LRTFSHELQITDAEPMNVAITTATAGRINATADTSSIEVVGHRDLLKEAR
jgi:hypothetical protein